LGLIHQELPHRLHHPFTIGADPEVDKDSRPKERDMNRKVWTGVLAGVLAAGVLLSVAAGAYRAGQRHEVTVTRVTGDGTLADGGVVRVIDDGRWGHGPGPGFLLFPLLGIGLVVLLVGRGRRGGYGGGWCGPGPGAGWGPESRMPNPGMEDWHRRAHEEPSPTASPPTG
jgi:hypothetical protein